MNTKTVAINGYKITIKQDDLDKGAAFIFQVQDLRTPARISGDQTLLTARYKDSYYALHN